MDFGLLLYPELVWAVYMSTWPTSIPMSIFAAVIGYKVRSGRAIVYLGLVAVWLILSAGFAAHFVEKDPTSRGYMLVGFGMIWPVFVIIPWLIGFLLGLFLDRKPAQTPTP